MSKSISSVIITPRVLLGQGMASLLQGSLYKVVAIAAEPSELPPGCCTPGPALAIVGMNRQDANLNKAGESIRLLRTLVPDSKVVLVVETNAPIDLQRVLALAPDTCIFNLGSRDTLLKVLDLTFADQRVFVFDKSIATTAKSDDEFTDRGLPLSYFPLGVNAQTTLSSRQREILFYLAQGKSNKEIARLCNLVDTTVKVHLKAILSKTNTQNRTQAAIWAIEHGLLDHSSEHIRQRDG